MLNDKQRIAIIWSMLKRCAKMLRRLQFSHGPGGLGKDPQGKWPICLCWDGGVGGNGETPLRHTVDCDLAKLLTDLEKA